MEDFAVFKNGYSHGNSTPFAFPGIVSGHPVIEDGEFPDDIPTIAELFDGDATGFSNNGHLTIDRGYKRGFDNFHDQYPPDKATIINRLKSNKYLKKSTFVVGAYQRLMDILTKLDGEDDEGVRAPSWPTDEIRDFVLRRLDSNDKFVWAHSMDPHTPYSPAIAVDGPPVDRTPDEIRDLNDYDYETDPHPPEDMEFQRLMYESNIRYYDQEIAKLLRELRSQSSYEDMLIIIVGDHGELFGEHGYMFHPGYVDPFDELLNTPLLVKYPGGRYEGNSFDHLVQHGDIIATIADELNTSPDRLPDGVYPLTDTTGRRVISKSNVAVRVTEPEGMAIRRRDGTTDGLESLSEVGRERLETATFPNVEYPSGNVVGVEEIERQAQLEALGYA